MGRSPAPPPPVYSSIDSDLNIKVDRPPPPPPPRRRPKDSYSSSSKPPPRQPFKNWVPWSVPTIVVVNILLFVIAMYINNCPQNSENCIGESVLGRFAFQSRKENPLLGPSALTLLDMGALYVKSIVDEHQGWRLVSCMWLHAGVYHVLANMLSLIFVGIRLEQEFGFVRIVPLYILSGIGGSLSSAMFVRTTISVGASGALFGLLGGMLSELLINWTIYENKLAALVTLVVIILINLAVGILPHVDNFAHLGGFMTGFLLGFVVLIRPQFKWLNQREAPANYFNGRTTSKYKTYQQVLLLLALVLLLAGFITGLVLLLQGVDGNDKCSWCHYLSCVPTPFWNCEARCMSSQYKKQLNLTCMQNNKSEFYILNNENSTAEVQKLCTELCSM